MARASRPTTNHLNYLGRAAARVADVAPLALLRGAEARAPDLPRIGEAKLPAQDVLSMVHVPSLAFPAASLEAIHVGEQSARVEGNWLGLTGPMGPLPLHLTEFAAYERRYARQQPFGQFLDLLAGRMLQFFYRAWAAAVPAASLDRPSEDHFGSKVAALTGAEDGAYGAVCFPARARLRYAALFASTRNPGAIGDALSDLLRLPVRIMEYVERWRDIAGDDRTRLGVAFARLGRDAIAGRRVRTAEEAFRVVVTVHNAVDHRDLLPGGDRYKLLIEALDAFAPPHLEWEIELAVASEAIRPTRLRSGALLGWSSWIGSVMPGQVRSDARLGANARHLARRMEQEQAA